MTLFGWMAKHGAPKGTAKIIGKLYLLSHQANPDADVLHIIMSIIEHRHNSLSYSNDQFEKIGQSLMNISPNQSDYMILREFSKILCYVESNVDYGDLSIKQRKEIFDAIKLGLNEGLDYYLNLSKTLHTAKKYIDTDDSVDQDNYWLTNSSVSEIHRSESKSSTELDSSEGVEDDLFEVDCPKCNSGKIEKVSIEAKNRSIYICSNYPECNYTLPGMPIEKKCPECGWPVLYLLSDDYETREYCPRESCDFSRQQCRYF